MKRKPLFFAFAFLIIANTTNAQVTDIDGHQYKTVKIGKQIWMAENLNVSHFRNGDPIPEAEDSLKWIKAGQKGKPAWCYYDRDSANGRIYNKLYNWYAVNDLRGLAPKGWHIPTDAEVRILANYLGGWNVAGGKMKATFGWSDNGNGTNLCGFTGLPGGGRDEGKFTNLRLFGEWWSSSANNLTEAWDFSLYYQAGGFEDFNRTPKFDGSSIRCVKD